MTDVQRSLDAKIQGYYDQGEEDRRLTRSVGGSVEFERMKRIVTEHLGESARVLDVGGATGTHSRWLAAAGHDVTLVDPVPSQVAEAAKAGTFLAKVGDARDLDIPSGAVDAVLLLGPLYHLHSAPDRALALAEAKRVLRPDGLLFAQGISRLTSFIDGAVHGDPAQLGDESLEILRTGEWTNPGEGFPGGHFHTPRELRTEVEKASFTHIELIGLEGPNAGALEMLRHDEEVVELARALADAVGRRARAAGAAADPLAAYSPHVLAIDRA